MNQVKQIFQLHQQGVGIKRIASILNISKNTVKSYLRKGDQINSPDEIVTISNPILEDYFKPVSSQEKANYNEFLGRAEYYAQELANRKKSHVTRLVLWEEDYQAGLIHLKYSRFCHHLQRYLKSRHPSMVMLHQPGDKMFIDFAGDKLHYIDRETGKSVPVEILLVTLGYSNYTLAIGVPSQAKEHFIEGLVRLITELGGVTSAVVPDNFKSAVTATDRYDPLINESFLDMVNYYGMVVLPARPAKPKDKAKVEVHVNVVYQKAYSRMRNMTFYSLEELNRALMEKVKDLNDSIMQDYGVSRRVLMERDERQTLKPLPKEPYCLIRQLRPTVLQNGHVKIKSIGKYLSVPYHLIGQKVTVLLSNGIARIYHDRECVATHILTKGGNWILEALLEDLEKKKFERLVAEEILIPIGMLNSTFENVPSSLQFKSIAAGHLDKNRLIEGRYYRIRPQSAGGLWSTPTDLAKFLILIQKSRKGDVNDIINKDYAMLMTSPVMSSYGLGFSIEVRGTGVRFFGHDGHNMGYICSMIGSLDKGFGVVIMTNSENGWKAVNKINKLAGRQFWGF